MNDWTFEKQEAEHRQRAGHCRFRAATGDLLEGSPREFRAVEDEVSQLIEPRFVVLPRAGEDHKGYDRPGIGCSAIAQPCGGGADEVGGRIAEYYVYRAIYATLSRAHAAIEQARSTATRRWQRYGAGFGFEPRRRTRRGGRRGRLSLRRLPGSSAMPPNRRSGGYRLWGVPQQARRTCPQRARTHSSVYRSPEHPERNVLASGHGDSMTGDDMLNGDYVIIDKARQEPSSESQLSATAPRTPRWRETRVAEETPASSLEPDARLRSPLNEDRISRLSSGAPRQLPVRERLT